MTSVASNGITTKSYSYDDFGRLSQATFGDVISQYTYNGDNLRQTKTVNGVQTTHIYDGSDIVADISDTTNVFVRGNGLAFLKNLDTGTTDMYLLDKNRDVSAVLKSDGSYIDYTYNAFGENITNTTYTPNPFEYCGEYTDLSSGLIYLRNRYYDPSIGRFISEDPAKDGLNWYVYCGNNPVRYIDPSGENYKDIIYGIAQSMDENNFGGAVKWASDKLVGNNYCIDSEYDYYLGRVIGDVVSMAIGTGKTITGVTEIIASVVASGTVTVSSSGALTVSGVTIAAEGVATGVATVTYGGNTMYMASKNFGDDYAKLNNLKKAEFKKPISGSGKEKATDVPSWAKGNRPYKNENGKAFASRLMDERYGKGNWNKSSREYSQIRKWGDRGFE